ncbi:MAG: HD-GYP domain-containing protein [Treponema sp.]|nr:HD-GYP domain-containing protein [Treponema sp.]
MKKQVAVSDVRTHMGRRSGNILNGSDSASSFDTGTLNLADVTEEFSMDELDRWTTLVGLVQSVIAFIEKFIPGYTAHVFYHYDESREYREIDREGISTIPEDSIFIGCLSMVSEAVSLAQFFSDYGIDDPIISHFLQNVYKGEYIVPIVHSFELLAFIIVGRSDEFFADAETFLESSKVDFLNKLSSRMRVNMYAASVSDRRQRELLHMTQFPLALQKHTSLNEVFANLLDDLRSQIEFDAGVCYAYDQETKMLLPFAKKGIPGRVAKLKVGGGISGQVFDSKRSIFVPSRKEHPFYSLVEKESFIDGSFISVPFGNDKTWIGVITLCRHEGNPKSFGVEHRYMLEIASSFIASDITSRQLYQKLDESSFAVVKSLTCALEAKDKYTEGHSDRVKEYSVNIAKRLGYTDEQIHQIRYGAMLHDIGKIGIGDDILNKRSRLSDEEYKKIKQHTEIGYHILDNNSFFDDVKDFVRYHHETLKGTGYYGKKLGEYPEGAMIVSCADIFDALTSARPYRKPLPIDGALCELKKLTGLNFPDYVYKAFEEYVRSDEFKEYYEQAIK